VASVSGRDRRVRYRRGVPAVTANERTPTSREERSELAKLREENATLRGENKVLRRAYEEVLEQYKLLKHRLFVAKAERLNTAQLEIEFAELQARLQALAPLASADGEPGEDATDDAASSEQNGAKPRGDGRKKPQPRRPGVGRRELSELDLPEERIELLDPSKEGTHERIGFDVTYRLGRRRPSYVRIAIATATYRARQEDGGVTFSAPERPREIVERGLLAPTMIAHLLVSKYVMGVPFYRQQEQLTREGISLDRSTMCRYAEEMGAALGSIVEAMKEDAKNAFCLSTDATGISIQPVPLPDGARQPCRKGHFFVVLADYDHIFFEYRAKHDSDSACAIFRGFSGCINADAHAIFNALYRGEANAGLDPPRAAPTEVGCWSHARRKFWEAAMAKSTIGREGVLRIRCLFDLDAQWQKEPPVTRQRERELKLAPLIDDFFGWVKQLYPTVKSERGVDATAVGYALRQEQALRAFLRDGRLRMENNRSERELRQIAVGRKAWLFCGSDDHAAAAANLFSLVASCKLHRLDPELYLAEMIHVLPQWPVARHLELAPKYWSATRARLDPKELAREYGPVTVAAPLQTA
jgi:transposase